MSGKKLKEASKETWVWLQEPEWLYYPARVEGVNGNNVTVKTCRGQEGEDMVLTINGDQPLNPCHEDSLHAVEDLVTLPDCCEPALLHNTRLRYWVDEIYCFIGPTLLATNPYKRLPLYTPAVMSSFAGKDPTEMPPHLFALAERSLLDMAKTRKDQTFVISGESGAGKSEATKFVIYYLAEASMKKSGGAAGECTNKLLEMSPILEAFGNAKTVRNDNSSRFGKWLQVYFDSNGVIQAARVTKYLLEKSRVALPLPNERNYHLFYNMFKGLPVHNKTLFSSLGLGSVDEYDYCTKGGCTEVPGKIDDVEDCELVLKSLVTLAIAPKDQESMWKTVAAVCMLGQVKVESLDGGDKSAIKAGSVDVIAQHLCVPPEQLISALTTRLISSGRSSTYTVPRTYTQCIDTRDALAKFLYAKLFDWTVESCNIAADGGILSNPAKASKLQCIGVLDIFGFESLVENSFEQLNINYTNEKLQQYFNNFIFKLEKKIYEDEKVQWQDIKFPDNSDTVNLIEEKPNGLLSMLDEECVTPKGSDKGYLDKVLDKYKASPYLKKPKPGKNSADCFVMIHYAGEVIYHTTNWLDKNRDAIGTDLVKVLMASSSPFVAAFVADEDDGTQKTTTQKKVKTIASQFKQNLIDLMISLDKGSPFFVRCLKPNLNKACGDFNGELMLAQLRYSGMLEAIRVRRSGYPFRYLYKDFKHRFQICAATHKDPDPKQNAVKIMQGSKMDEKGYRTGTTKMFMDMGTFQALEALRVICLRKFIIAMQKVAKGFLARKWYKTAIKTLPYLQAASRAYNVRKCMSCCKKLKQVLIMGSVDELKGAIESSKKYCYMTRVQELVQQAAEAMNNVLQRDAVRKQLTDAVKAQRRQELEAALYKAKEINLPPEVPEMKKAIELMQLLVKQDDAMNNIKDLLASSEPNDDALADAVEKCKAVNLGDTPEVAKAGEIIKASAARREAAAKLKAAVDRRDEGSLKAAIPAAKAFQQLGKEVAAAEKLLSELIANREAIAQLRSAIQEKTKKSLTDAIKNAEALGVDDPLLNECKEILRKQLEMLDLQERLEGALDGHDAETCKQCLQTRQAKNITLPPQLIQAAEDFIERWELEQKTRAQIPLAVESDSLQFVQDVLEQCVKLHLRHPMLAALVDREELLRRDEALKEVLDEMDDSPGRTAAERKQRIKELTELLAEFHGEETPMVLRGKERLANAKEIDLVESMLKSAIVTKNLAMLETSLYRAQELKHHGPNVDLGEEVRNQLTGQAEIAKAAARGDTDAVISKVGELNHHQFAERVKKGVEQEHYETVKEQQVRKRKKSILSTSQLVLTGESVVIDGERHLRNNKGRELVQKAKRQSIIEQKIMEMVKEDELCEEDDEDDVMKLVVLLLKNELPGLFTMYTEVDEKAFKEFIHTYTLDLCPIFRQATVAKCTESVPRHSLTHLEESLEQHCLNLFKGILGFMGLRKVPFPETLIEEIVITGMQVPAIRDELYAMLMRQLTENSVSPSVILKDLWSILYVMLMAFRPSDLLYPYFIAFVLQHSLNEKMLDKDRRWPQFCLRVAVGNDVPIREMSLMKAELDKKIRGAIITPKVCPVSGKTWYIAQREVDLYAAQGKKVPDKAPECRVQIESVTKQTLADAKSGKKPLPSYMTGTASRAQPLQRQQSAGAKKK